MNGSPNGRYGSRTVAVYAAPAMFFDAWWSRRTRPVYVPPHGTVWRELSRTIASEASAWAGQAAKRRGLKR